MNKTKLPPAAKFVPVRRPGQWVAAAAILITGATLFFSIVTNENYQWGIVSEYFLSNRVLYGLENTILLTVVCMSLGIICGLLIAVLARAENVVLTGFARLYVWFFRGVPIFVQLLFWGYLGALYPTIGLTIPLTGISVAGVSTNQIMTPWVAATIGLSLHEAGYMAEIIRSGLESVGRGQIEASQSLGMTKGQIFRRIMLPQAMRVIIPTTGNNVISMLKMTSVVSVLAFPELLYSVQLIYAENFLVIPLLLVASIWYLVMTTLLTVAQGWLERYFSAGTERNRKGFFRTCARHLSVTKGRDR